MWSDFPKITQLHRVRAGNHTQCSWVLSLYAWILGDWRVVVYENWGNWSPEEASKLRGLAVSLEETWDQSQFSWSHVQIPGLWSRTSSQCRSIELSWGQMFLCDPKLLGFTFSQPPDGSLYPLAAWSQSCRTISNLMDPNMHEGFVSPVKVGKNEHCSGSKNTFLSLRFL